MRVYIFKQKLYGIRGPAHFHTLKTSTKKTLKCSLRIKAFRKKLCRRISLPTTKISFKHIFDKIVFLDI